MVHIAALPRFRCKAYLCPDRPENKHVFKRTLGPWGKKSLSTAYTSGEIVQQAQWDLRVAEMETKEVRRHYAMKHLQEKWGE